MKVGLSSVTDCTCTVNSRQTMGSLMRGISSRDRTTEGLPSRAAGPVALHEKPAAAQHDA
ncbi:hypothetical protein GCM10009661_05520 [Catellatospora chokoriensis]